MIALDTNILVRVVTGDDLKQVALATAVMTTSRVWVSKTVLLETAWVLELAYELSRDVVLDALGRIVGFENLVVEDMPAVVRALGWAGAGMGFADALHLASSAAASEFVTFDRDLVKKATAADAAPTVRGLAPPTRATKK